MALEYECIQDAFTTNLMKNIMYTCISIFKLHIQIMSTKGESYMAMDAQFQTNINHQPHTKSYTNYFCSITYVTILCHEIRQELHGSLGESRFRQ